MKFNPFDYPLAWADPAMLSLNSDFVGHIPFVMGLVDLLRPGTVVELGTHTGNSYCAFCQAVRLRQMPTRCYAVDTWRGDASMGDYANGDAILAQLRAHHDPNYASFSTLLRMTFDEALPRFADGSIDLLHIDGCHTYEAVRHDFEAWLPKLSDRGVVLLHDTAERRAGFGVYRFWAEVAAKYPSLNFEHCHGLGMLLVGARPEPALQDFMQLAAAEPAAIQQFFAFQGLRVGKHQALDYSVAFGWHVQSLLNAWAAAHGKPVNPQCGTIQAAQADPISFFYNLYLSAQQALGNTSS